MQVSIRKDAYLTAQGNLYFHLPQADSIKIFDSTREFDQSDQPLWLVNSSVESNSTPDFLLFRVHKITLKLGIVSKFNKRLL